MSNRAKFKVSYIIDIDMDDVKPLDGETKEQAVIQMLEQHVPLAATADDDIVTDIECLQLTDIEL